MNDVSSILQAQLQAGFDLPAENKFYFNGFSIASSNGDFVIVLLHNNQPIALLNGAHPVMKTLYEKLGGVIENFEEKTGQRIMTLDEIGSALTQKNPNE